MFHVKHIIYSMLVIWKKGKLQLNFFDTKQKNKCMLFYLNYFPGNKKDVSRETFAFN